MAIAIHNFFTLSLAFFQCQQQHSGLVGRGIVAEADTDRAGLQSAAALVSQRCAMNPSTDADPLAGQGMGQFFTIHIRNKRYRTALVFPGKYSKSQFFQSLYAAPDLLLLHFQDVVDPLLFQIGHARL